MSIMVKKRFISGYQVTIKLLSLSLKIKQKYDQMYYFCFLSGF